MDILSSRFDWDPESETSIEVDPSSVHPDRIEHLRSLGFWNKEQEAVRGHVMTDEDKIRAAFIEQAMCQLRVDLSPQIRKQYSSIIERLVQLAQTDGVSINNTGVRIHEPMMARLVAQAFDAYGGAGQFSSAM